MAEIPSNKSEFEKTWYLAFSNYQHGLEALANAYGTGCSPADFQGIYITDPKVREKRKICRTDYVIGSQNAQTYCIPARSHASIVMLKMGTEK